MARATRLNSDDQSSDDAITQRWWFYVALALAVAFALFAARILGMPRGLGVTREPQETGEPARSAPTPNSP